MESLDLRSCLIAYVEGLYLIDPAGEFRRLHLPNDWNESLLGEQGTANLLLDIGRGACRLAGKENDPGTLRQGVQSLRSPVIAWLNGDFGHEDGKAVGGKIPMHSLGKALVVT